MRILAFISFLASLVSVFSCRHETKPQILLVGVYHNFPDSQQCNWKTTYDKVLRFHPDQIAVEYDLPGDTVSLKKYLGESYPQVWDSVMLSWIGKRIKPKDSVVHYQKMLSTDASIQNRLELWKYYHLQADMGNRDFQSYLIQSDWEQYAPLLDTTDRWQNTFYQRHTSIVKRRKNGEFFNLVFPLAKELNISYLYPTDYKGTYEEQSNAFEALAKSLENTKEWDDYMEAFKGFSQELDQKATECLGLEYTNTEPWLAKSDHVQAQILSDLKNPNFDAYVAVWYKRNQEIANRIQAAIQVSDAKRMAVFYGQMHIYPVRKYLEEMGYRVLLLEEL